MLFFGRHDPALLTVTRSQQHEAIERLMAATTIRRGYYLLLVLAVLITSAGLLMNNAAIIIGGMVMAPMLLPILALSLSVVARSAHGMLHALGVLASSVILTVTLAYLVAYLAAYSQAQVLLIPSAFSPLLYFTVAFCSGIAAVFAWVKEDIAPAIAGIAIAVSLLPPLCATGIAAALPDPILLESSLRIFALNVSGIVLAAIVTFLILGFGRSGKATEKAVQEATAE